MEKALFLKDLSTGCVDALIIYEASSEEDIENAIIKAKEKDFYAWEDLLDALPKDCKVFDKWSYGSIYY